MGEFNLVTGLIFRLFDISLDTCIGFPFFIGDLEGDLEVLVLWELDSFMEESEESIDLLFEAIVFLPGHSKGVSGNDRKPLLFDSVKVLLDVREFLLKFGVSTGEVPLVELSVLDDISVISDPRS